MQFSRLLFVIILTFTNAVVFTYFSFRFKVTELHGSCKKTIDMLQCNVSVTVSLILNHRIDSLRLYMPQNNMKQRTGYKYEMPVLIKNCITT